MKRRGGEKKILEKKEDMAGAFLTSVASKLVLSLGEYLIAPIGRQFGYVLCYKSYVEDLKDRLDELKNARVRVQQSVNVADNDSKPIHTDVKDWLKKVEETIKEAEILLISGENAKDACFRGWIPNPMVHHPIGRKVKKMTQVIQGLHEKSQNSNFREVCHESTPIGIVTATTSAARSVDKKDVLESRASIIESVMKALANDKLEEIELSKCHSMQQFVAYDEADEIRNAVEDDPKVKSCNLHRLTLRNLSEMTSFCKTMDHPVAFFGQQVNFMLSPVYLGPDHPR
ncbi:hypothetical protein NL676_038067 [Syzygium grande]|nr:hypothetical protein NL676_038067 [Syzygium grande]